MNIVSLVNKKVNAIISNTELVTKLMEKFIDNLELNKENIEESIFE